MPVFGTTVELNRKPPVTVICDDPPMALHTDRPWFRACAAQRLGLAWPTEGGDGRTRVELPTASLAKHLLLGGATGSGKTRALLHILEGQIAAGCSAVVVDPKGELIEQCLALLRRSGVPPEQVTLLDPRWDGGVPGWNALAADLPLSEAITDFVSLLAQLHQSSWGPRLELLLTSALWLVGAHGGSVFEVNRALTRDDYREALLRLPAPALADPVPYDEAVHYFVHEFERWGRGERATAVAAVSNKLGGQLLRTPFLRSLLCAQRTTLHLAELWRQPRFILVHLDRPGLGEAGARFLAGLLVHQLFRTALRTPGRRPVVLLLDELPAIERMVGEVVAEIVTQARSTGLQCHVAFQNSSQLSDELRTTLLANCAAQVFFRQGHADAKAIAASLAAGSLPHLRRLTASVDAVDRESCEPEALEWRHPIRDGSGRLLRLPQEAWERCLPLPAGIAAGDLAAAAAASGIPRLYVHAADSGEPVALGAYVQGLRRGRDYRIEGPALQLVVRFPRPRLTAVERGSEADAVRDWIGCLQSLPPQHAVVRLEGGPPQVVRVSDVPTASWSDAVRERYLAGSAAATAQSAAECLETVRQRAARVEQLARGTTPGMGLTGVGMDAAAVPTIPEEEISDGSIV
jgi:hypothetical protein